MNFKIISGNQKMYFIIKIMISNLNFILFSLESFTIYYSQINIKKKDDNKLYFYYSITGMII